jgi:hypothetical protein
MRVAALPEMQVEMMLLGWAFETSLAKYPHSAPRRATKF